MNFLEDTIQSDGESILFSAEGELSKFELKQAVARYKTLLVESGAERIGIALDNCFDWVALDIASMDLALCAVPIPTFFSQQQVRHTITSASLQLVICEKHSELVKGHPRLINRVEHQGLSVELGWCYFSHVLESQIPEGTYKITYTSGSSGTPKGVCLSLESQLRVAQSLVKATAVRTPKHLSVLPMAVLLENIAGLYAPILAGGTVTLLNPGQLGFNGSQLANPSALFEAISLHQPNTLILVPELLLVLIKGVSQGWQVPNSLEFVAVGGAKVASGLLEQAREAGIPVYQGYGLSECASVISLSNDVSDIHSVGRLLPHSRGHISAGQWVATDNLFLGYLNQPETFYPTDFNTEDQVSMNPEGELSIEGRSKNIIINSLGRNIQPEWIEAELMATGLIYFVVVLGESQPTLKAVIVPTTSHNKEELRRAIRQLNTKLPDYARIADMICVPQVSDLTHLLTSNMQPKRDLFEQTFR